MPELTRTQSNFRTAMASLSAAVTVITTDGPYGPAGLTVSATCSVTDSPPTVLVCVNRSSRSHAALVGNGRIALNVLGPAHEDLALRFAGATKVPTAERFDGGPWDRDTYRVPVLRDAAAAVVGRIEGTQDLGSHSVLFVEVDHVVTHEETGGLVYFQRGFHSIGEPQLAS